MMWLSFLLVLCIVGCISGEETEEREKRATQIWKVGYVPDSKERTTLLKDFEPYFHQWGDESLSSSTKHSSKPALHIHYRKGSYTGSKYQRGAGFYTTPKEIPDKVEKLILTYEVYFEHFGFGTSGKLPGLFGGETGDGAYKCSGGHHLPTCFTLRLMWRENGAGELYAYIPEDQEDGFLDRSDIQGNGIKGVSIGRGKIHFKNGAWNSVYEEVTLNKVGHHDGQVKFCNTVSGKQECYTAKNLVIRNNSKHYLRGMYFATFFGGSHPEDAAPGECDSYFRNFRISYPSGYVVG